MDKKKDYKFRIWIVVLAIIAIAVGISMWTHWDDISHGYDAGFEQTK